MPHIINKSPDYSIITELPGIGASKEQMERLYQRYKFAAEFCQNKRVLEVACGGGVGLGVLAKVASQVTAGDIDSTNVAIAQETWKNSSKITVCRLDAQSLPFEDASFDAVLLFEAIYYLNDVDKCLAEFKRVLRPEGILVIESANKEWTDFNPSPFSIRYLSVSELYQKLTQHGFKTTMYKSYDCTPRTSLEQSLSRIKRFAVKWRLIPKSMKFKQYLKRLVFGELIRIPTDISTFLTDYTKPEKIAWDTQDLQFKVIYGIGKI